MHVDPAVIVSPGILRSWVKGVSVGASGTVGSSVTHRFLDRDGTATRGKGPLSYLISPIPFWTWTLPGGSLVEGRGKGPFTLSGR